MSGAKPTHELKVKDLESKDQGMVGVAWENDDGSFTIRLQPCVSLTYDNLKNKALTLFPIRTESEWAKWHAARAARGAKKAAAGDPQE